MTHRYARNKKPQPPPGSPQCPYCQKRFGKETALATHMLDLHPNLEGCIEAVAEIARGIARRMGLDCPSQVTIQKDAR